MPFARTFSAWRMKRWWFRLSSNTVVHSPSSPGDYLLKCRVAHSQSLISQGVSLSDACYQSGFGSMSTFIRAFRTLTGRTPSQYRAESRE